MGKVPFCTTSKLVICVQVVLSAELSVQWFVPFPMPWSSHSSWEATCIPGTLELHQQHLLRASSSQMGLVPLNTQVGRSPGGIRKTLPAVAF